MKYINFGLILFLLFIGGSNSNKENVNNNGVLSAGYYSDPYSSSSEYGPFDMGVDFYTLNQRF
jgi:hypothetical protein